MIAIIDEPSTESAPLQRAFHDLGARAESVRSVEQLQRASRVIVTGHGSFAALSRSLRDRGLVPALLRAALDGRPFLGIAAGLHLLLDVSYENGQHTGLGLIPGKAIPFESDSMHPVRRQYKPPHVGWTPVHWTSPCPLLAGLETGASFFFDHSCRPQPLDPDFSAASANFGVEFIAVVASGRTYGVQFIPEKSQESGCVILSNFAAL